MSSSLRKVAQRSGFEHRDQAKARLMRKFQHYAPKIKVLWKMMYEATDELPRAVLLKAATDASIKTNIAGEIATAYMTALTKDKGTLRSNFVLESQAPVSSAADAKGSVATFAQDSTPSPVEKMMKQTAGFQAKLDETDINKTREAEQKRIAAQVAEDVARLKRREAIAAEQTAIQTKREDAEFRNNLLLNTFASAQINKNSLESKYISYVSFRQAYNYLFDSTSHFDQVYLDLGSVGIRTRLENLELSQAKAKIAELREAKQAEEKAERLAKQAKLQAELVAKQAELEAAALKRQEEANALIARNDALKAEQDAERAEFEAAAAELQRAKTLANEEKNHINQSVSEITDAVSELVENGKRAFEANQAADQAADQPASPLTEFHPLANFPVPSNGEVKAAPQRVDDVKPMKASSPGWLYFGSIVSGVVGAATAAASAMILLGTNPITWVVASAALLSNPVGWVFAGVCAAAALGAGLVFTAGLLLRNALRRSEVRAGAALHDDIVKTESSKPRKEVIDHIRDHSIRDHSNEAGLSSKLLAQNNELRDRKQVMNRPLRMLMLTKGIVVAPEPAQAANDNSNLGRPCKVKGYSDVPLYLTKNGALMFNVPSVNGGKMLVEASAKLEKFNEQLVQYGRRPGGVTG